MLMAFANADFAVSLMPLRHYAIPPAAISLRAAEASPRHAAAAAIDDADATIDAAMTLRYAMLCHAMSLRLRLLLLLRQIFIY